MGELIKIDSLIKGKGIEYNVLTCSECGCQSWVNFFDDEGCVCLMACNGYHKDGRKCDCLIDLDEIEYE